MFLITQFWATPNPFKFLSLNSTVRIYKVILIVELEMIESLLYQFCSKQIYSFFVCFLQIPNFHNYKTKRNNTNTFLWHNTTSFQSRRKTSAKWMTGKVTIQITPNQTILGELSLAPSITNRIDRYTQANRIEPIEIYSLSCCQLKPFWNNCFKMDESF